MGANDRIPTGFIPKEQVGEVSSWEFQSLLGGAAPKKSASVNGVLTERDRRAFEQGRAQGRQEGIKLAEQLRAEHGREVQAALDTLRQRFAELESQGADLLLDLALDLAHKLVQREVAVQRDAVLPVLREAIASVIDKHAHLGPATQLSISAWRRARMPASVKSSGVARRAT